MTSAWLWLRVVILALQIVQSSFLNPLYASSPENISNGFKINMDFGCIFAPNYSTSRDPLNRLSPVKNQKWWMWNDEVFWSILIKRSLLSNLTPNWGILTQLCRLQRGFNNVAWRYSHNSGVITSVIPARNPFPLELAEDLLRNCRKEGRY